MSQKPVISLEGRMTWNHFSACLHNYMTIQDFVTPIVHVQGLDTARELFRRKLDKLTSWDVVLFHVPDWLVGSCWTAGVLHYLFGRPKIMWIFWSMQHAPLVWIMGQTLVNIGQCLAIWPVNLQKLSKVESFSCHQHSLGLQARKLWARATKPSIKLVRPISWGNWPKSSLLGLDNVWEFERMTLI